MGAKKMFVAVACLVLLFNGAPRAATVLPHVGTTAAFDAGQRRKTRARRVRSRKKMSQRAKEGGAADEGTWGGEHVTLSVGANGARVEFDCAHGEITEPLKPDAAGKFDLPGTFVREGGPIRIDITRVAQRARYSGRVEGRTMTLVVRLADTNQTLDTYTLTRGSEGRLRKCR